MPTVATGLNIAYAVIIEIRAVSRNKNLQSSNDVRLNIIHNNS